jgi:copper chaperone CopZ
VSNSLAICVITIEQALSVLSPPPTSVQISIEGRSVTTVQYPKNLSPTLVISALEDVGFDVSTNQSQEEGHAVEGTNRALANRRTKHLQQARARSAIMNGDVLDTIQ